MALQLRKSKSVLAVLAMQGTSTSSSTSSSVVNGQSETSRHVEGSTSTGNGSETAASTLLEMLLQLNDTSNFEGNVSEYIVPLLQDSFNAVSIDLMNSNGNAGNSSVSFVLDITDSATNVTNVSLPWYQNWDNIPYERSGYTQLGIVCLGFFITMIMIMIVVGNLLVCIAISTEKSLKTVQNWFIASLAVSDLLLGLVIMPFSLAYELMGFWIFGDIWCEVHHALDVLLCTASINNLCLISLDRYWSVTQAVEYLKKRTPSRAMFMIAFVWVFSACVSLPPLVGWKGKEEAGQCSLSDDLGYVLYSAFGSFFIPAVVMVFVYARIFVAARSRARRHVKKKQLYTPSNGVTNDPAKDKSTTTTTCTSQSNPSPPDQNKHEEEDDSIGKVSTPITPKTPTSPGSGLIPHIQPRLTFRLPDEEDEPEPGPCSPARQLSSSSHHLFALAPPHIVVEGTETPHSSPTKFCDKRTDDKSVSFCTPITQLTTRTFKLPRLSLASSSADSEAAACTGRTSWQRDDSSSGSMVLRTHSPTFRLNNGAMSETRFVSGDEDSDCVDSPITKSGPESRAFLTPSSLTPGKLQRSPYGSSLSIADYDDSDICDDKDSDGNEKAAARKAKTKSRVHYQAPPMSEPSTRRSTTSDAERHKRKIAKARERRATFILGLIMISFISAWLPFFTMYIIQGICKECNISPATFTFAFWLG